jgi:hypothetical protein
MKDYSDFIVDAYEWQANRPRFYIDQLMPNSTSDFGVIGGRWQKFKTNLSLELLACLATGDDFFGLKVEQIPVVFLDFEGNRVNISERIISILQHHSTPKPGYLNITNLKDNRFILHNNINRLVDEVKGTKLALIDGTKHLIAGEYIKPSKVKEFAEDLLKAMDVGKFCSIVTWQVKKAHQDVLITPGDLETLKGAGDLVEDCTFALLLEQPPSQPIGRGQWWHPPESYVNLYAGKYKEASIEFPEPFKELEFDRANCQFKIR